MQYQILCILLAEGASPTRGRDNHTEMIDSNCLFETQSLFQVGLLRAMSIGDSEAVCGTDLMLIPGRPSLAKRQFSIPMRKG